VRHKKSVADRPVIIKFKGNAASPSESGSGNKAIKRSGMPKSGRPKTDALGREQNFFHEHSLSIVAISILALWICLYSILGPDSHIGSFFGNAIADWLGVVVMVIATKYFYEIGSAESNSPPKTRGNSVLQKLRKHSLSIFIVLTGIGWSLLFAVMDSEAKWGQVVGNIVSEWTQIFGLILLTKRLTECHSKESAGAADKDFK